MGLHNIHRGKSPSTVAGEAAVIVDTASALPGFDSS